MGTHSSNSCLENPMDRGAWLATVHGVTKSQTLLKRLSKHPWMIHFAVQETVTQHYKAIIRH